jgi:fatty-acid desaturase
MSKPTWCNIFGCSATSAFFMASHATQYMTYRVDRKELRMPDSPEADLVRRGKVRWDYAVPIFALHMLAFLALVPWLFSWTGLITLVVGVNLFGQLGVPIGYHRLLTHRSFRVAKWFERSLVTTALCCGQNTPARWVAWHRMHHQHSDDSHDPHSPLVTFFWSHVGWLVFNNDSTHGVESYYKYARDVLDDPYYMYLEKHRAASICIYLGHAFAFFFVGLLSGWAMTGEWASGLQFGLSLLVWGVIVRTVYVWHITWAVNSLGHLFGYRNHETNDDSRNNWFVAFITGGEGWHNNHHHDPTSATVQHRWWELDLNYYIIKSLEWIGLVTHVVPRHGARRPAEERGSGGLLQHQPDDETDHPVEVPVGGREKDEIAIVGADADELDGPLAIEN